MTHWKIEVVSGNLDEQFATAEEAIAEAHRRTFDSSEDVYVTEWTETSEGVWENTGRCYDLAEGEFIDAN
jgi:hypothetical protein